MVKDSLGRGHGQNPRREITRVGSARVLPLTRSSPRTAAGTKQLPAAALFPLSSAPSTSPVAPELCPGRVSASLPLIPIPPSLARLVSRRRRPPPPHPSFARACQPRGAQNKFLLVGALLSLPQLARTHARPSTGGADGCASEGGSDDGGLQSLAGTKSGDGLAEQGGARTHATTKNQTENKQGKKRRDECLLLPYCPTRSSFLCCLMEIMAGSVFTLAFGSYCTLPPSLTNSNRDAPISPFLQNE